MNVAASFWFSRADATALGQWWWTIDRTVLALTMGLMATGAVLAFAASPAAAARFGLAEPFHFANRHLVFIGPAMATLLSVSFLPKVWARRLGVLLFLGALAGMALAAALGPEINGARRWIPFGPINIQPSEFAKPGLAVFTAWILAIGAVDRRAAAPAIAFACLVGAVILCVLQPDYGQAALLAAIWGAVFFAAGMNWRWMAGLSLSVAAAASIAYLAAPHVQSRVDRFLNPASGDTYQVDTAAEAVARGGLLGVGPGEGLVKRSLPDAHTDFIFAVAVEEFGALLGLAIIAVFAALTIAGLKRAWSMQDAASRLAACGLYAGLGLQAMVNIGVSLNALPAKGMTLPFLSYGGSSLLASSVAMGLALALTRSEVRASPPRWA